MKIKAMDIKVPLDVPEAMRETYLRNYLLATRASGRLMLFAGDQKMEHLNDDFFGEEIDPDDGDPIHLFKIASAANIGVFAAQLGLIARYGMDFTDISYLVKLNSKTHLVKTAQADPFSPLWYEVSDVVHFRDATGLSLPAVGYTIYLGSEHEARMLLEAARLVHHAHRHGLITVLWIYPRGRAIKDEKDPHLIAGAAGVAACLGSDFVKVNYPQKAGHASKVIFKEAIRAAGRTGVVCAGGAMEAAPIFLQKLHDQIHVCGAAGNATGRNIHQKPLAEAIRFCNAIYAITVEDASVEQALEIYHPQSGNRNHRV
jgi:fructose-bisphosphate aldolase/6-deoxy-5-ketofructose 1-phosphate synthase